jgi:acyl-CoA thioesterase I
MVDLFPLIKVHPDQEKRAQKTVVCLGDSITLGLVSANYVDLLNQHLGGQGYVFLNYGVNGDLAYNMLRRIDHVISIQPEVVIILAGTNDVVSALHNYLFQINRWIKLLPKRPSASWYRENMLQIVRKLKNQTRAKVALASIPILGEDLSSPVNKRVRFYNGILKEIAAQEEVAYLPVGERMEQYLRAIGNEKGPSYRGGLFSNLEMFLRSRILGQSFGSIYRKHGFVLLTDGIHMNPQGAELIAEVMEKALV